MKKVLLTVFAVCCLAPVAAFASHPLITDAAETVAPSKFEAETSVEFATDTVDRFSIQETITGGLFPQVDAFITVPFSSLSASGSSNSGLNDVIAGVKWNLRSVDKVSLAVKPFFVLPVGDEKKSLGEGGFGLGVVGVASLEIDKQITIDGNLLLKHQNTEGDSFNEFGASAAGRFNASRELQVVGELVLSKKDVSGSKVKGVLGAGVVYAVQKNLDIDLGLRLGLTKEAEDFVFLGGVTFKF